MQKARFNTKMIATMAILTAFSYILYVFVKFPLPFLFPSFLDIQFSDLPIILGSYMFGIPAGVLMAVARFLLKMPLSTTAMVGETADLLITIAYITPAVLAYKRMKSDRKLIYSLILGTLVATLTAMVTNQFLLIPFYVEFIFGGNLSTLTGMLKALYPSITDATFYLFYQTFAVIPFNLLRLTICSTLVGILHQKLTKII